MNLIHQPRHGRHDANDDRDHERASPGDLLDLIPRFFDATEGEVLVDGINVRDYKLEALYNKIGYVPQRAVLFKGTVESNVMAARDLPKMK